MNVPEISSWTAVTVLLAAAASLVQPRSQRVIAANGSPLVAGMLVCSAIAWAAATRLPWVSAAAAIAGVLALLFWGRRLLTFPPAPVETAPTAATGAETRARDHELSDRRFREALARSNITVFAQDRALRYIWVYNPRIGVDADGLLGRTEDEVVASDVLDEATALKRRAMETGQMVNDTIAIQSADAGRLYFDMTVTPTFDAEGEVDGILCSAFDVTEMRLFEVRLTAMAAQLAGANQRFELALDNSPITVFEQGTDLRYSFVYNAPPGLVAEDLLDRTDSEIFSDRDARRIDAAKQRVLASGGRDSFEIEMDVAGASHYYAMTIEAKRDQSGVVVGIIGTMLDLTDRRRDEKRIRLMLRELTHRSKNLLAVIQAMARKTASLSGNLDTFVSDFSLRLRAIAAAHDLLVSESWSGADLRELLQASLAPTIDPASDHVSLSGPTLMLTPDAAQNLGLAFHELATNASKYGALSRTGGHLQVSWERLPEGGRILWTESGGPPVLPPERRGFGRILLERLVGVTLNGSVDLDFRPGGLVCEITLPVDGIAGAVVTEAKTS